MLETLEVEAGECCEPAIGGAVAVKSWDPVISGVPFELIVIFVGYGPRLVKITWKSSHLVLQKLQQTFSNHLLVDCTVSTLSFLQIDANFGLHIKVWYGLV